MFLSNLYLIIYYSYSFYNINRNEFYYINKYNKL